MTRATKEVIVGTSTVHIPSGDLLLDGGEVATHCRSREMNEVKLKMAKAKMEKTNELLAIARAAYEAYVAKDRPAVERLIADDFHFTSPLDNRIDRATYFERCWPNSAWIKDFDYINLVPEGDRIFVTYEGHSTKGDRFRNTEIVTVRNGQIVDVEVYFGWSIPHKAEPGGFVSDSDNEVRSN